MLNQRSTTEELPARSFTRTTTWPSERLVIGEVSGRVQKSGSVSANSGASSAPAGLPFTAKFAVTDRDPLSTPKSALRTPKRIDWSGPELAPALGEDRFNLG